MALERIPKQSPRGKDGKGSTDKPIPGDIYPVIDNDLARDNVENDLPAADLAEL